MSGQIIGTASYVPDNKVTNQQLEECLDTSHEWIVQRTGIESRHIVSTETVSYMATSASIEAVKDAGIAGKELDLIIVATSSTETTMPTTASLIQAQLGGKGVCFDMNVACSGFVVAFNTAQAYIQSGMVRTALVVGAESMSRKIDWEDRSTGILFGDGAGAVVLQAKESLLYGHKIYSDGSRGMALRCNDLTQDKIEMDGREVFKFATRELPVCISELLEEAQVEKEEVAYYILHQANKRIVESVAKRLEVGVEKFPMNLQKYGNTSAASIPILLHELKEAGKLKTGMKLVMVGFGAGLTWGSVLIEW